MQENDTPKSERRSTPGRRKGINTTSMHLKLRNDLLSYVKSKPNKNKFINDCIEAMMKQEYGL